MAYIYNPGIWLLLGTILLLLSLATYCWHRRSVIGTLAFPCDLLVGVWWATGPTLEFAAMDLAAKITRLKLRTAWQLPAVSAVPCCVLEYAWPRRGLRRRNLNLLSIVPLLIFPAILTDDVECAPRSVPDRRRPLPG